MGVVPGMYKYFPWCESLKQIEEDAGEKRDPSIKATESNEDRTLCLFLTREACNEPREPSRFVEVARCLSRMHAGGVASHLFYLFNFVFAKQPEH